MPDVRHTRFASAGPKRVIVSGASGFVGRVLVPFLSEGGHRVERLVRRPARAPDEIAWDPKDGSIDAAALEQADAVVHLAGAGVAEGRWSAQRRANIRESRAAGTRLLCETLAGCARRPSVLVSASAIGIYGHRGDEFLDEESVAGAGFLPDVCTEWEGAAEAARGAGIRTVCLRIGLVLGPGGGALGRMRLPFAAGLGARLGDGRQFQSWISLDDLVGAIHHALFTPALDGPVNAVTPEPVSNTEFTRTLGRVLRRPTPFAVPAWVVRLALGAMGEELFLASARVLPAKLERTGFPFLHPGLEEALRSALDRRLERS